MCMWLKVTNFELVLCLSGTLVLLWLVIIWGILRSISCVAPILDNTGRLYYREETQGRPLKIVCSSENLINNLWLMEPSFQWHTT